MEKKIHNKQQQKSSHLGVNSIYKATHEMKITLILQVKTEMFRVTEQFV